MSKGCDPLSAVLVVYVGSERLRYRTFQNDRSPRSAYTAPRWTAVSAFDSSPSPSPAPSPSVHRSPRLLSLSRRSLLRFFTRTYILSASPSPPVRPLLLDQLFSGFFPKKNSLQSAALALCPPPPPSSFCDFVHRCDAR